MNNKLIILAGKLFKLLKIFLLLFLFVLLFFSTVPLLIPVSKAENYSNKPFSNSYFIEIDDILIHYRYWKPQEESDKWILLIHGLGGSTYSWENNAAYLADNNYNVIAVDIPPFGYSDRSTDINNSIDNRALLLLDFISIMNRNAKWDLMGHSMGGSIVQAMAILSPEQIDKTVLVAPIVFNRLKQRKAGNITKTLLRFKPFERAFIIVGERIYLTPKRMKKLLKSSYGQEPNDEQVQEYYKAITQPGTVAAFLSAFSNAEIYNDISAQDFSKKTLTILGKNDTWIPYNTYKSILNSFENNEIIIFQDAAHCPMETHYDKFNEYVINFLTEK